VGVRNHNLSSAVLVLLVLLVLLVPALSHSWDWASE